LPGTARSVTLSGHWGEVRRKVWYDSDCGLVRMLLPVSGGVLVTLELQ
jgi:hypothetical protein